MAKNNNGKDKEKPRKKHRLDLGDETKKGIIVDPGDDPQKILNEVETLKLDIGKIFLTHGHIDHVRGCGVVWEKTGAEILIHPEDLSLYDSVKEQAKLFGLVSGTESPKPDRMVKEGATIEFGKIHGSADR